MARPRSGRLALAVLLVALVAVLVALAVPAALAVWGPGTRRAPAGAAVDRAHAALAAAERERLARLSLAAQLLAAEEALATVLRRGAGAGGAAGEADGAAALADLLAQRRPRLRFDLALVLDAEGRVVAAGEGAAVAAGTDLSAQPLVAAALAEGAAAGAWRTGDGLAHVAVERVAPDFELLGHVLVGAAVDQVLALEVARASGAAVTFAAAAEGGAVPVASSLGEAAAGAMVAAAAAPGAPLAAALAEGEGREARLEVGGEARRMLAVPLTPAAPGPAAGAAVLSAAAAGGAAEGLLPLAAGAAAGLLVALLLAPLVARRAFTPAARLTEVVEAAPRESFARRLEPRRYRALAPLAAALDRLFRVLHEERSLAAAAGAARRRAVPAAVAGEAGAAVAAERGAVALFDLRRYARLGDDARQAAADLGADLGRLRQAVESAGGRLAGAVGHRALAAFAGDDAPWRAVLAAASGLAAVAGARGSSDEGEPAAAAVASGRLLSGAAGSGGGFLAGPAVQLAESVLRETAPGDLAITRAVHREIGDRLAARGAVAGEQRGLLSPQPLVVLGPDAVEAVAGGTPTAPAPGGAAPAAGRRFAGRWEVLERAGSSPGAELWRVREAASGREAALRWLPGVDPARRRAAAGVDGPLERARRVEHPGLAAIEEVGEAGEGVYLVREWVDGVPLPRLGELAMPAALGLARQLAAALAAVHGEGLAHGRVAPENVIVEVDGRARLVELGTAEVAGPAPSAAAGERLLAPERRGALAAGAAASVVDSRAGEPRAGDSRAGESRAGDARAGDARADVYALGALLHRLALGRWPGEPPAEGAAAPPAGLPEVLARATADDPERRFADAGALAAALDGIGG